MDNVDSWRLNAEVSVVDAALLHLGLDPGLHVDHDGHVNPDGLDAATRANYYCTHQAFRNAILSGDLRATIRRHARLRMWDEDPGDNEQVTKNVQPFSAPWDMDDGEDERKQRSHFGERVIVRSEPDWELTTVRVEALTAWIASRGMASAFFVAVGAGNIPAGIPDFLDRTNPRFALKLAAAISAWQACGGNLGTQTARQALESWLRDNAADFGLMLPNGMHNLQGIKEAVKVANWKFGGPAKTPGG